MASRAQQIEALWAGIYGNDGEPLAGGKVWTYEPGTSTLKTTWTDKDKTTPQTNPIILDDKGRAVAFGDGRYKFVITDSNDNQIDVPAALDGFGYALTYGSEKFISEYSDLTAAVAAIGSVNKVTLVIDSATTLTADTTVTDNIHLDIRNGYPIPLGNYNLTINGPVTAGLWQIFDYTGTGVVTFGAGYIDRIYPQWFGAVGDGSTDNYDSMTSALASLSSGGICYAPKGDYFFAAQGGSHPVIPVYSGVTLIIDNDATLLVEGGSSSSGVNTYSTALFVNSDMVNGNQDISIIGGKIKSASSSGCGGFLAFKNVVNLHIEGVELADINEAARLQISYCTNVSMVRVSTTYDSTPASPWSYEDGIRIGSGCTNVKLDMINVYSGDDCIALNNEQAETQMSIVSQSGVTTYSATGADIKNIEISNVYCKNHDGNAIRFYIGSGMTSGDIHDVVISNVISETQSPTSGGTIVSMLDGNAGSSTRIYNVSMNHFIADGSNLTAVGSPGAFQCSGGNRIYLDGVILKGNTTTYAVTLNDNSKLLNAYLDGAGSDSVFIEGDKCVIRGNVVNSATSIGVHMVGASHNIVSENIIRSTGAAVKEDTSSDYNLVINNNVSGAGSVDITSVGSNSVYRGNIGYNPVGTQVVTLTGSPFSYTAGPYDVMLHITGGTLTSPYITIGGTIIHTSTPCSVFVPANTTCVINYTSAPTVVAVVE